MILPFWPSQGVRDLASYAELDLAPYPSGRWPGPEESFAAVGAALEYSGLLVVSDEKQSFQFSHLHHDTPCAVGSCGG